MAIRRGAAAEEAEFFGGGDLMPGSGGNEDGITGGDVAGFAVDFHDAVTFEDEVKFLAQFVMVALGGLTDRDGGLGQRLVLHGRVGAIEDAADGAAVFRGEGSLLGKVVDGHGCAGMVRQRGDRASLSHEL